MFAIGSAWSVVVVAVEPAILGSHAVVYADAARAWLAGGDPWRVGPPLVVFSGPPTMLLPYAPFALLPADVTRFAWVAIDAAAAVWAIRTLGLPAYWLAFPPLFEAIVLGHPEVLVLALLVVGLKAGRGRAGDLVAGLSAIVKPYAALPLLAERRWWAFAGAAALGLVTLPFLPWSLYLSELSMIGGNLARQAVGDSTFGQPVLMAIGALALVALGPRRALWLAVPVLLPYAQPIYKVMTIPMLPPVLAIFWALPVPGLTLAGVVVYAVLVVVAQRRRLPAWLTPGMQAALRKDPASPAIATAIPASAAGAA